MYNFPFHSLWGFNPFRAMFAREIRKEEPASGFIFISFTHTNKAHYSQSECNYCLVSDNCIGIYDEHCHCPGLQGRSWSQPITIHKILKSGLTNRLCNAS